MRRSPIFILLLSLALSAADAATVTDVTVRGASAISSRRLTGLLGTRNGQPFSAATVRADCETIVGAYRTEGFYAAEAWVDTLLYDADSAGVSVVFGVREGARSPVALVRIEGASAIPEAELRAELRTVPGEALDPALLEDDIARLLALYGRRAHPFAAVRVGAIESRPDTGLEVRLDVEEGPTVTIREIRVEGLTSTDPGVVLRETRLRLPEPYDEERVAGIADRLRRLSLFSEVRDPELRMSDGAGVLLLNVREGNTSSIDGVVGYAPAGAAATSGGGTVAGLFDLDVRNLAGTARAFQVHWQRDARSTQETRFRYAEPWLFGLPLTVGGAFEQRQQDSSYVRRAVSGHAHYLATGSLLIGASVRHEVTIPSAGVSAVAFSRTLTAGLEISYDSRNDRIAPSSGLSYRSEYRVGDKKTFGSSAEALAGPSALQQVSVDLEWFLPATRTGVVRAGLHARQVTNRRLEASDLYRVGGTNSLRGFRELQFAGSSVAWTNFEYRHTIADRSFAFGFFDTGYIALSEAASGVAGASQSVTYGYGVGVRTQTPLGSVGVSLALGKGDPFSQAKVHIGLVNEF